MLAMKWIIDIEVCQAPNVKPNHGPWIIQIQLGFAVAKKIIQPDISYEMIFAVQHNAMVRLDVVAKKQFKILLVKPTGFVALHYGISIHNGNL
jgi:hypothetical protein